MTTKPSALLAREQLIQRLEKAHGACRVSFLESGPDSSIFETAWAVRDPNDHNYVYMMNYPLSFGCWGVRIRVKERAGRLVTWFDLQDDSCRADYFHLRGEAQ
jgi:hypothetical protein